MSLEETLKNKAEGNAQVAAKKPTGALELVKSYMDKLTPEVQKVLPRSMVPDRFMRMALTAWKASEQLQKCDPVSFIGAVMKSAQLGLEFGPLGHSYPVPFKGKVQFVLGYQGYIELFYRSGKVESVFAEVVREGDLFDYCYGLDEKLTHKPSDTDRGDLLFAYAYAKMTNGGRRFVVLTAQEVMRHRNFSAAKDSDYSPWKTDPESMWKKTAIRALAKWLPKTVDVGEAVTRDETEVEGAEFVEVQGESGNGL